MEYDTLSIRFQPGPDRSYSVIASSSRGDAPGEFRSPFADLDLENFVLRVGQPRRRGVRRFDSPEMETAKTFGGKLFDELFSGDVRDLYHAASAEAESAEKGLRVILRLGQAPELSQIPWEYLCDDGRFLSVSERTPIVRYLDLKKAHKPLTLTPPIRILGMVSSPTDVVELEVEEEKSRLNQTLERLTKQGHVELVWLEQATLGALLQALERHEFHIFHYIGHGAFDSARDDGMLLLEDERGRGKGVSGMKLGQLLADERTLRLAVLNACEGARMSSEDPFAGVAASLVQNEIPSVVAMQFEISDKAAILFAGALYSALARGSPVDTALASARKAIWADYNDTEWGTPVLFMRVPDGRIFDVQLDPVQGGDLIDMDEHALDVRLLADAETVDAGDEVSWLLTITNVGRSALSGITALDSDGSTLVEESDLQPARKSVRRWRTKPQEDTETTVTVRATDDRGDRITEQVTAHIRVRPGVLAIETFVENVGEGSWEFVKLAAEHFGPDEEFRFEDLSSRSGEPVEALKAYHRNLGRTARMLGGRISDLIPARWDGSRVWYHIPPELHAEASR